MTSTKGPARGTRIQDGRYYLVRTEGKRRIWTPLTRVSDGLPAFYAALAQATKAPTVADDVMPNVVATWEVEVMASHAPKTRHDEQTRGAVIASEFDEFRARDIEPPDVVGFLKPYRDRPRTHNLYRAQLRELMRFAIEKGWREPGTNPVTDIVRTMSTPARHRYPTDSEVRRIKVGGDLRRRWPAHAQRPDAGRADRHGLPYRPAHRGSARAGVVRVRRGGNHVPAGEDTREHGRRSPHRVDAAAARRRAPAA